MRRGGEIQPSSPFLLTSSDLTKIIHLSLGIYQMKVLLCVVPFMPSLSHQSISFGLLITIIIRIRLNTILLDQQTCNLNRFIKLQAEDYLPKRGLSFSTTQNFIDKTITTVQLTLWISQDLAYRIVK